MGKRTKEKEKPTEKTPEEVDKEQALAAFIEEALTKDRPVEVAIDSLEARVGYGSLLRELQHAYLERVAFYRSQIGGSLSLEEARANAYHACKDKEEAQRIYDRMMSYSLDNIDFVDMYEMWPVAPRIAESIWEML